MAHKYTKNQVIQTLQKALQNIKTLYMQSFLNRTGKTSDSDKELYSEIIANYLLNNSINYQLSKLPPIMRQGHYPLHTKIEINPRSKRYEDKYSQYLVSQKMKLDQIGEIIGYQIPLKSSGTDKAGKIDLISKSENGINLIEFKHGRNKETLLRAVLEIATYDRLFNCQENLAKLNKCLGQELTTPIRRLVVVSDETTAAKEAKDLMLGNRPNLKKLIELLNVQVFILKISKIEVEKVN